MCKENIKKKEKQKVILKKQMINYYRNILLGKSLSYLVQKQVSMSVVTVTGAVQVRLFTGHTSLRSRNQKQKACAFSPTPSRLSSFRGS